MVSRVPPGRIATYGDIAAAAGRPGAARAVGTLMRLAPRPGLPYHRIVAANGRLGGYGGRIALKAGLLRAEGLIVRGERVVNFAERRWQADRGASRSHRP